MRFIDFALLNDEKRLNSKKHLNRETSRRYGGNFLWSLNRTCGREVGEVGEIILYKKNHLEHAK